MAHKYVLKDRLEAVPADAPVAEGTPVAEVLTSKEFVDLSFGTQDMQQSLRNLATVENTYLDVFPSFLIGSFAVPNKNHVLGSPLCFAFYLDKTNLIFLDEEGTSARLLDAIASGGVMKEPTVAHCLFEFMKLLIKNDLSYLAQIEDRMEDVEEAILDHNTDAESKSMLVFRRKLLRIDTYYQQLVDMASGIAENENKLLTHEESRLFLVLVRQAERLLKRSQTLKEYSLQLRELYQTQIDIRQYDTMQFVTVSTTLFAPLTLITSWFGMNFANMPGLDWEWGYPAIIVACLVLVALELLYFRKKKWL